MNPKIEYSVDIKTREMQFFLRGLLYESDEVKRSLLSYISALIISQLGNKVEFVWPKLDNIALRVRAEHGALRGAKSNSNAETISMMEAVRPKVIELLRQLFPGRQKQVELVRLPDREEDEIVR